MLKHFMIVAGVAILMQGHFANAQSLVTPPNYPDNGVGATEFDWQSTWGTIHMHTSVDGLMDPGATVSGDGSVGCILGGICKTVPNYIADNQIGNGIKYDIKNSLLNCMSKIMPNWATQHGEPASAISYSRPVCSAVNPSYKPGYGTDLPQPKKLLYVPIYDKRANDLNSSDLGKKPGCIQQMTNTCVQDMHHCEDQNGYGYPTEGHGYRYPVTHVFTPDEIKDLGGSGAVLPTKYYHISKKRFLGNEFKSNVALGAGNILERTEDYDCSYWRDDGISNINKTACVDDVDTKADCKFPIPMGPKCDCEIKTKVKKTCQNYFYRPITEEREALSLSYPSAKELAPGAIVEEVNNVKDPNLARLKSYYIKSMDVDYSDNFIIVDPENFYDLRHYAPGGKYDSGYTQKDAKGFVATYDACPVLGLDNGYSGICDPTGKAGCNLPIYWIGPKTNFTDAKGRNSSYNAYIVKWSGYAKKWGVITPDQYLANTENRVRHNGKPLYLLRNGINDNPIIMLTRADEYCDIRELVSTPVAQGATDVKPDMPCIQYLQYQLVDPVKMDFAFVDLFNPDTDPSKPEETVEFTVAYLFDRGADGKPDFSKPVPGSGTDELIGGDGSKTGFVSFKDASNSVSVYNDVSKGIKGAPAIIKSDYSGDAPKFDASGNRLSGPVRNTKNSLVPGEYLGYNPKTGKIDLTKGVGINMENGTASIVRMANTGVTADTNCVVISYFMNSSAEQKRVFIPTNSQLEFASFFAAASMGKVPGVKARKCKADFMKLPSSGPVVAAAGTSTWNGTMKCSELTTRPACNQAKMITAERYCQLENGAMTGCESCSGSSDPDSSLPFTDKWAGGLISKNPRTNPEAKCNYAAACFSLSSTPVSSGGCPTAGTVGGHVFCLSGDTKIKMKDGSEKEIKKIKAGDEVLGFDARFARTGMLHAATVKATAITKNQDIIKINNLRITPLHKVFLASGRAVEAREIRVGDQIMLGDGKVETVTVVDSNLPKIKVYNLVLDNGSDGYIANGIRVLSYPNVKGLAD